LTFMRGSVVDEEVLEKVFSEPYEAVFHLAALFANQNSVEHPEADLRANGSGILKMLKWSHRTGVGRFVFSSSSCVYGAQEGPLSEDSPRGRHQTPYAMTKALGEDYLQFHNRYEGLPAVAVRYFNSYGPGEYPGPYRNVIPNFFSRAMSGEPLTITGTGQETRDFTFVQDMVVATIAAAEVPAAAGEEINIGTGVETPILELAERVNAIVGNRAGIKFVQARTWDHVLRRKASIAKAARLLDYRPTVDLEDGLRRTHAWLQTVQR
jgi:UDP-glucose 4-epimerase